MKVADFEFELPEDRIADRPVEPRATARLLVVRPDGFEDRIVRDLPELLAPGDLLVLNDTKVIPARLRGRRGEAKVEVTLHKEEAPGRWRVFARPAKRLRPGDRVVFTDDFSAEVAAKGEAGELTLSFDRAGVDLMKALEAHGEMPLPPYISRPQGATARDRQDYQTVYAAREGAVAAPTAGLHFTDALFDALERKGVERVFVTLHVGAGTFLPVKAERVADHAMHAEYGEVSDVAAARINAARDAGGRIVAVGTTSLRLLESAAGETGAIRPFADETDIFIVPGTPIRTADMLLTNFHLPRSTLFMLVCAFAGTERMKAAYAHAIGAGYRFYSYGDACLLERSAGV